MWFILIFQPVVSPQIFIALESFLGVDLRSPAPSHLTDLLLFCPHRLERAGQPDAPLLRRWLAGEQSDSAGLPRNVQTGAAGGDEDHRVGGQDEGPRLGAGAAEGEEAGGAHQEDVLQSQAAEAGRGAARVFAQQ